MRKEEGLMKLTQIIKDDVRHNDYDRVVELADTYYKLTSGDDITELLSQVLTRETEEEFEQRQRLSNPIIPSVLGSCKTPFKKVVRKKPLVRRIDWPKKEVEKSKVELEEFISKYWGDAGLDQYLEYAFVDYNFSDPNAFLITEFDAFDPKKGKAKPYPFIATSEQSIMFEIHNNTLEYLVVRLPIEYMDGGAKMNGFKFTMYLGNDTIQMTQTSKPGEGVVEIGEKYYTIEEFVPKGKKVPARRFGYVRDPQTSGRTFVSTYSDVMPYLRKLLKNDSELDLTTALTAFPQRFAYVSACQNEGCRKGELLNGDICPSCGGTGKEPFHKSVMDVITLALPKDVNDIINLEQLMVYKYPAIELLEFQKDYINELKNLVFTMLFNKEMYSQTEVAATATEKVLEIDNMNDTLRPFATALSTMWRFVVEDIATFTDLSEGLILEHQYPNDFKFKSMSEMMAELKAAKDAGASTSTIAAIEDDINELLYSDRPEDLKAIRIKNSLNPFRGYSEENVRLLISQGKTTEENAIRWANLESIFNDLEQEHESPWIYDMKYSEIIKLVKEKAAEYMGNITPSEPIKLNLNTDEV